MKEIGYGGVVHLDIPYERVKHLQVWPENGYAECLVTDLRDENTIICPRILPNCLDWKSVVGVPIGKHHGQGIRVAVIDTDFRSDPYLKHVRFTDTKCASIDMQGHFDPEQLHFHGTDVLRIITAIGPTPSSTGIAPAATVQAFCVPSDPETGLMESGMLHEAIRAAASEFRANIINLSFGVSDKEAKRNSLSKGETENEWEELAEFAADLGAILIAAAGNDPDTGVHWPARSSSVIAVSGVGICAGSKPPSYSHHVEQFAKDKSRRGNISVGMDNTGNEYFADLMTSHGHEIDCCSLSIGFCMERSDRSIVQYCGTSFAAPIVSAMLATMLESDEAYASLSGRERAQHAREKLTSISQSLGLSAKFQGSGLVRFSAHSLSS
jgi:subtilisin family serine protease